MTKKQLYDAIVKIYKQSGQGTAGFIRVKIGNKIIDELISEGKIKSVQYRNIGEFLCLSDRYCIEEDCNRTNSMIPLHFIRNYIGLTKKDSDLAIHITPDKPEIYKDYINWLEEHKEDLKFFEKNSSEEIKETANEIKNIEKH